MESSTYPHDLLRAQSDWSRTYAALATTPSTVGTTALRRHLLRLSTRILWHPYWAVRGRSPAARVELRRQALARDTTAA